MHIEGTLYGANEASWKTSLVPVYRVPSFIRWVRNIASWQIQGHQEALKSSSKADTQEHKWSIIYIRAAGIVIRPNLLKLHLTCRLVSLWLPLLETGVNVERNYVSVIHLCGYRILVLLIVFDVLSSVWLPHICFPSLSIKTTLFLKIECKQLGINFAEITTGYAWAILWPVAVWATQKVYLSSQPAKDAFIWHLEISTGNSQNWFMVCSNN